MELPGIRIFIILLSALILLGMVWFLTKSVWGLRIRSVTQNREMSNCLGIPTDRVDSITFGLGSGLAGVAGCAITLLGSVGPNLGGSYIVSCFMVIVLGGCRQPARNRSGFADAWHHSIGGRVWLPIDCFPRSTRSCQGGCGVLRYNQYVSGLGLYLYHHFLQFRPNGMFPQKGRSVDA